MNNFENILKIVNALLPIGSEIASLFIHNEKSQHKLAVVVSDTATISALAHAVAQRPQTAMEASPAK